MVNKRRGNKQGVKGAVIDLEVVSSRLNDVGHEARLEPCDSYHWQEARMMFS